ncbi:MAG: putative sugar O-methyltransferase [Candidatus Omnitrophica bacterium]|nr:putative sugar O-methyltransferase [Candidatus Omnitrophota bacterium]
MELKIKTTELVEKNYVLFLLKRYFSATNMDPEAHISSHWKIYGAKLQADHDVRTGILSLRSSGLPSLKLNIINRILSYLCVFTYFFRLEDPLSHFRETIKAYQLLQEKGYALTNEVFKQVCAVTLIKKHLKMDIAAKFSILIIGDGPGITSLLLKTAYPNARIILVDIGKVLLYQSVNMQLFFPQASHYGVEEGVVDKDRLEVSDLIYCPAEHYEKIDSVEYTLSVNINSMQEMNMRTVGEYFRYIRKYAATDNIFYCLNRVSKKLPCGEMVEFNNYPWDVRDIHIIDGKPVFVNYHFSRHYPFVHIDKLEKRHRLTKMALMR